ncbi:hypothetical protein FB565_002748 [Actinoplanes lutulentus]|uniref:Uncharacterized protein n=1 Tax=Actinoplanes lutulentus TaxID=1287878 RepID=A0A327YYH7_9ACTN|nr:DUF5682 family protein [Actinoplanes lutulentus]MBB2943035.1 hypothetical protein [Actinoplanes lutulentus]RAK26698.1 hypothetical protein B0I29_12687 [Actinoplanes lutulentus]
MSLTVVGVRHHSPACARLVGETIAALRPAYVLIEGPADMNDRIGELLLGHELPVAVFTSYADEHRRHGSWAPFCGYSPEWVALAAARETGAEPLFIDLPAWHEAFADRSNRYADAEQRYAEAVERLCTAFGVDNTDALWDHLVEMEPGEGLAERLAAYFDLIRGEAAAGSSDTAREAYMAEWIRAAVRAAGDRPVVAVVGGFHRPALLRLADSPDSGSGWPEVPTPPEGAVGGSYLVPYSFRRLDAFGGYQSGMPSPEYYQRLWEDGPAEAARYLVTAVAGRLRERGQPVSTADLIAARTSAEALARLRGHRHPARVDVLDGLAAALINEALDVPLPWSVRGTITAGQHPAVVEMTTVLSGDRIGRLHPDTPLPPLVHAATAELERHGFDQPGEPRLDLLEPEDRERSRLLHRLRVLGIPGYARTAGPATGIDPVLTEQWRIRLDENRLVALIEAGGYGPTLEAAATARIGQRVDDAGNDLGQLADALFDAAFCGVTGLAGDLPDRLERGVAAGTDLGELGRVLTVVLALWRHDRMLGTAGSDLLGAVVAGATRRILWLAEGWHGAGLPADLPRIRAVVAVRDAVRHAERAGVDRTLARGIAERVAADRAAPPDLRGAFYGLARILSQDTSDPGPAVRGAFTGGSAGDWLAGLFGVARESVLAPGGILGLLDELVRGIGAEEFLLALPALRQAFEFFPPRERVTIADQLLEMRGLGGSGRDLLRTSMPPEIVAAGLALDEAVEERLAQAGLLPAGGAR